MTPSHLELGSKVTIITAAALHQTMLNLLAVDQPLLVDASRVEEIDTASLQLLVSLWRTRRQRGRACAWSGVSEPLRRAAGLIGVTGMLQLADAEATRRGADAA